MTLYPVDPGPLPPSYAEMTEALLIWHDAMSKIVIGRKNPFTTAGMPGYELFELAERLAAVRENVPQNARGADSGAVGSKEIANA